MSGKQLGGVFLAVFVQSLYASHIKDLSTATCITGVLGVLVRQFSFLWKPLSICFIILCVRLTREASPFASSSSIPPFAFSPPILTRIKTTLSGEIR